MTQKSSYLAHTHSNLDYVRSNKHQGLLFFVDPPKIDGEEIVTFGDALIITAQDKLDELIKRNDYLEHKFHHNVSLLQRESDLKGWDETTEWFWTYLESYKYSEIIYVHAWIKYWIRIYEGAAKEKFLPIFIDHKSEISALDIESARAVPIYQIYEGSLFHSFNRYKGICPFHHERTASFTIFEADNHFYCFGCHKSGDVIDFYRLTRNTSFQEAVKALNGI